MAGSIAAPGFALRGAVSELRHFRVVGVIADHVMIVKRLPAPEKDDDDDHAGAGINTTTTTTTTPEDPLGGAASYYDTYVMKVSL